mgnify:CR=1 FL=1
MSLNPNVRLYYPEVDTAVHFFHRASGDQGALTYEAASKVIKRVLAPTTSRWVLASAFISVSNTEGPAGPLVKNYVEAVRVELIFSYYPH